MAGKANPSTLLLSWQLLNGFDVIIHEEPKAGARQRSKRLGQLLDMRITEKGRVENKTDQVLVLVSTKSQNDDDPPFALQMAKLNYAALHPDLLAAVKKGQVKKPSLVQLASKSCSNVSASVVSFCVSCLQEKSRLCTGCG